MPDFKYESALGDFRQIAGLDEAGRGPWCGPVVAGCVMWVNGCPDDLMQQINDSKKLTGAKREALFDKIIASTPAYGIGQASAKEIDELNILQASFLAMQRAYDDMVQKGFQPTHILIDGNRLPQKTPVPAQAIIGGDAKSLSISAASILAKVTRDRIMTDLAKQYPAYGWDKNAGYGTKTHQQALQQFGITPHHRLSYKPIQKIKQSLDKDDKVL